MGGRILFLSLFSIYLISPHPLHSKPIHNVLEYSPIFVLRFIHLVSGLLFSFHEGGVAGGGERENKKLPTEGEIKLT